MGSGGIDPSFLTSALMEVSGQLHVPAALLPVKDLPLRYALDMTLGGPQSLSGRCEEENNVSSAGNRTLAVQPLARRYAD
jgi:hypothetical protein